VSRPSNTQVEYRCQAGEQIIELSELRSTGSYWRLHIDDEWTATNRNTVQSNMELKGTDKLEMSAKEEGEGDQPRSGRELKWVARTPLHTCRHDCQPL
jgi:hypothetical protein